MAARVASAIRRGRSTMPRTASRGKKWSHRLDVYRDFVVRAQYQPRAVDVIRMDCADTFEDRVPIEHGVGEGHTTPARCRLRAVVHYDGIAFSEQAVSHSRTDVTHATHQNKQISHVPPPCEDQFPAPGGGDQQEWSFLCVRAAFRPGGIAVTRARR